MSTTSPFLGTSTTSRTSGWKLATPPKPQALISKTRTVITKDDYPLTKWRQDSEHWRWNYCDDQVCPGRFTANKQLITPVNVSECSMSMVGEVNNALGVTVIRGDIEVKANGF